ncbi:MAG: O-methyltransferase [Bacteroidales bacterium]|nr:O-methyltransferase [Bacteroidales bacterium]MDD4684405.1 O-methyltransferase [Bacteroidales bacterium]
MTELQISPFIDKRIVDYCEKNVSEEPEDLVRLNRKTQLRFVHPHMISGNWQGTFLKLISKMVNPKNILEIGTFSGYSTFCLAEGLQEGGIIHTIEKEEEYEDFLLENLIKRSNKKIKLHIGKALDILPTIEEEFDLIFIDADKASYPEYYNICIEKLRPSGIIIADNILWYGKVGLDPMPRDKQTLAINNFNELITHDPRVENVIIPIRDGLMMGRKL